MTSYRYIKAILYLAVAVWAVVLYFNGQVLSADWLRPLSMVTTLVVLAVIAFDLWLWKLPLLRGWFVKRPVVAGTWKAVLRPNWKDPATQEAIPPVEGYMVARQTFSTLSLRLFTEDSTSELVGTDVVCAIDGTFCISGVYRNEPRHSVRQRSPIHYGAVWLRVVDDPEPLLEGHYWTDRTTAGEMVLSDRQKQQFHDFASAKAHFASKVAATS